LFARTRRFLCCLEVMPTLPGSTRNKCLSASWNASGWSEMSLAFGISYLDCGHNRGANGLSGIGDPIIALRGAPQWQKFGLQTHASADGPGLLLLPQPANTSDRMSISAIRLSVSRKSPFAGTLIETDRPCPQLGNWPCLAEASAAGYAGIQNWRSSQPMDRFEKFLHLVIEATAKARKLRTFALDSESRAKVNGLMERVQKSRKTMEALNRASTSNGKGLEKATLDSALDRLIETMDGVNRELDDLLAKAKK